MSYLSVGIAAAKLAIKAHAPTIMVVTGVVSMGAAAVTGAKQTLKVEEVLEKHVPSLEKIKHGESLQLESYTKEDSQKDRVAVYTRAGFELIKLYAVPTVLFVGGAALVFGGHRMMLKRNATLAIAFTGLKKAFDTYRSNVRDEFGSEVDQAMLHGYRMREVVDPVTGETEIIRERDWDHPHVDPYNRVFEAGASNMWRDDLGVNKMFVAQVQRRCNALLGHKDILYLNEVYEALGFEPNDVGQVSGWKVRKLPDGTKDIPFVDFGLDKPHPDDFKYNRENAIYLDINCQGLIVGGKVQKMLESL